MLNNFITNAELLPVMEIVFKLRCNALLRPTFADQSAGPAVRVSGDMDWPVMQSPLFIVKSDGRDLQY